MIEAIPAWLGCNAASGIDVCAHVGLVSGLAFVEFIALLLVALGIAIHRSRP